jgi:predicted TIM-barrel fold metal-dependent hydrolase
VQRLLLALATFALALGCSSPPAAEQKAAAPQFPDHPDFKPALEQNPMPKSTLVVKRTDLKGAKYPAIDFHFHGRRLETPEDYAKMVEVMNQARVGMICNMDGGFGETFDKHMKASEAVKDRFLQFARVDFEGINEPGWSEKNAAELERCFLAGAAGLKINKVLGLELKNPDGSYIQSDDPRFDPIWEMCAKHNKPVMMHVSDALGRFEKIGPENERWEAGLFRSSPEGNYFGTGRPGYEEIFRARENMLAKHPKTRFVHAHIAMMYFDLKRVGELLDKFPNSDVEVSAAIQDLGRQPYSGREFLIKYQDRVLFGTDGNPARGVDEFWMPHFRYLETNDEYFDHPAQLRGPLGAPLHGRWAIHGAYLPDDVLRKIYYQNALKYLPAARESIQRQIKARGTT